MPDYKNEYTGSHLLAIGINEYSDPRFVTLGNAESDAREIAEVLSAQPYNFQAQLLLGRKATKHAIQNGLFNLRGAAPDDRILVYFAGHGYTLTNKRGHEIGYLACVDTLPEQDFTALELDEMTGLRDHSDAKHVTFIFDACFSGQALGLTRGISEGYLDRRAYQVLSAGAGDQTVSDFRSMTRLLVQTLRATGSELITLNHLGQSVQDQLRATSKGKQIPQFGHLTDSQGGDFVFFVPEKYIYVSESESSEPQIIQQMRQAAQEWVEQNKSDAFQWPEERLKLVHGILEQEHFDLNEVEREFVRSEFDRLLEEINNPKTSHKHRSWIGERLEAIGDRRPGVGLVTLPLPPLTDPREVRLWGDQSDHVGLPDIVWLKVNGGQVTLEEDAGEFVVKPFYIAKYPITYTQFQACVDAPDGFSSPGWWQGLGADDRDKNGPRQQRFQFWNNPRENVSWWDAVVFCQWLNTRLGLPVIPADLTRQSLPSYQGIRLPAEWEWQIAAAGDDARFEFPWGQGWDGANANTWESGLGRTTAVGMYPQGAAPCGALDMSGNVDEWCLNEHDTPENISLEGAAGRVVRGGSWGSGPKFEDLDFVRAARRNFAYPPNQDDDTGFRVCVRPLSL